MQSFFSKKRGALAIGFTIGVALSGLILAYLALRPQPTLNIATAEDTLGEVELEQVVLSDNEFVKITTSSLYMDSIVGDYIVEIEVENKTPDTLYLYSDLGAVNHYMISPFMMDNEIKGNAIKSLNINLPVNYLSYYNITEVGLIEFNISVEDSMRTLSNRPIVLADLYQLSTKTDKYDAITDTLVVEGKEIFNDAGIKLVLTNPEDLLTSPNNVEVYMENNTDQPYTFFFNQFMNEGGEFYDPNTTLTVRMYSDSKYLISKDMMFNPEAIDPSLTIGSAFSLFDDKTTYTTGPEILDQYVVYWNEVK